MTEATRLALELINKQFPKAPLSTLSRSSRAKVESFSTGSLILDQLFGIGGWPKGRLVEVIGKQHAGKTTLCLHALAQAQKFGVCAFIDTEQRANFSYAAALGVDVDSLVFDQPSDGADAYDKVVACLESKMFSLVVLDSIAHAKPRSIAQNKLDAANVGTHGKLTTGAFDRMLKVLGNTTVICTNQVKKDFSGYGTGEYSPGGDAPMYDCDLIVRLRKSSPDMDADDNPVLNTVTAKVLKNSCGGIPYREAEFTIRFGQGVAPADDVLDAAVHAGIIHRATNGCHTFDYEGKKTSIGRSREAALAWVNEGKRTQTLRRLVQDTPWFKGDKQAFQAKRGDDAETGDLPQASGGGTPERDDQMYSVRSDIPIPSDATTPSEG